MAEAVASWRDFYAAVANAGAALLGLVFVGMSLQLTLRLARPAVRSLALGSAITLIQPMLVALLMLMPFGARGLHGIGLLVLAGVLTAQLAVVLRIRVRERAETGAWLFYRFAIPLGAAVLLAGGGIGILAGWSGAVAAPAVAVFVLFVIGVQDAWDLLTGRGGSRWRHSIRD